MRSMLNFLTLSQGACELTKWQFEELLGRRQIVRPDDEDDLAADLAYGRRGH
jgi:hypothetical protein